MLLTTGGKLTTFTDHLTSTTDPFAVMCATEAEVVLIVKLGMIKGVAALVDSEG